MDAKYLGEDVDGLESGKSYEIEGFTGSMAIVLNGDNKLVQIPYAHLNDDERWDLSQKKKKQDANNKESIMAQQYQGKNVRSVREARDGDPGWVKDTNQVVVTLDDGSEQTCKRSEVASR